MEAYVKEESKDDLEMDPEMEKYIEAQLAKRLGRRKPSETADAGNAARTEEDELYSIPENLRVQHSFPSLQSSITSCVRHLLRGD